MGRRKRHPHQFSSEKRAKTAGSGELDCSSEESVVGLLNAININMHPRDKIIPPCVTPNKIDDGPEGNVDGVIKETVINDSVFSQTALYRISKPLIEHLQKLINDLMLIGYGGAKHTEKKWGQKGTKQFILHIFSRINTLFELSTTVPTSVVDTIMVDSVVNYLSSLQVSRTNFTAISQNTHIRFFGII